MNKETKKALEMLNSTARRCAGDLACIPVICGKARDRTAELRDSARDVLTDNPMTEALTDIDLADFLESRIRSTCQGPSGYGAYRAAVAASGCGHIRDTAKTVREVLDHGVSRFMISPADARNLIASSLVMQANMVHDRLMASYEERNVMSGLTDAEFVQFAADLVAECGLCCPKEFAELNGGDSYFEISDSRGNLLSSWTEAGDIGNALRGILLYGDLEEKEIDGVPADAPFRKSISLDDREAVEKVRRFETDMFEAYPTSYRLHHRVVFIAQAYLAAVTGAGILFDEDTLFFRKEGMTLRFIPDDTSREKIAEMAKDSPLTVFAARPEK